MNDHGKSDGLVVPAKPPNKPAAAGAELVEGRRPAEGNAASKTRPGHSAGSGAPSALDRVRRKARTEKKERFTALLHHVDVDRLREAYRALNPRAATGVDDLTWEDYGRDLEDNLRDLHARVHRGSYRARPTRRAYIPKPDGRQRPLGVAALEDKILQRAVVEVLNGIYETDFLGFSYGFRPGRSAHDALDALAFGIDRKKVSWVLDADIRDFFDSVPHDLVLRAVARHTDLRFVLLYVERWLKAPLQLEDGSLVERDRGTPQGSAISPLLANVFLHYAFDLWMAREFPGVLFERYCDDAIVHARSERQARELRAAIAARLAECGLALNERKTRIVYCKDSTRRGSHEHERFDFLGYTFRPRLSRNKSGGQFVNFLPAASDDARKRMRREVRRWRLHLRPDKTLTDLARIFNPIIQGWINYYGRFYRSVLKKVLRRINAYLVRWAQGKYKRLRRYPAKARRFLVDVFRRQPDLFAHWRFGTRPDGWTMGAR